MNPAVWRGVENNNVEGFFPELLPENTYVVSKIGWTLNSRQEAAIIATPDGKTRYLLVILADEKVFGDDMRIFPDISLMVYDRMLQLQY